MKEASLLLKLFVLGLSSSFIINESSPNKVLKVSMAQAKDTTLILQRLRALMTNLDVVPHNLDAYIIPSGDAHNSEYIADCDNRRAFVSGFDGSAGTAIVTKTAAFLWTDGRYYIQALQQLDKNWTLMKMGLPDTPSQAAWLSKNLPNASYVGVDPLLMTQDEWESMSEKLRTSGKTLTAVPKNLVDLVWSDRPVRPKKPVIQLDEKFNGNSTSQKIADVRKKLSDADCQYLLVTELDEIAWLLNLRGSDIDYNPVFFAYVLVTPTAVEICIDCDKLSGSIEEKLKAEIGQVTFHPYEEVQKRVKLHVEQSSARFFVSKRCNHGLVDLIPPARRTMELTPIALMKALKNPVEIQGMENCHIRDAAALCEFFAWLEKEIEAGTKITEISAADKLEQCRAKQKHFMGLSFPSISSSGPNGAVIHYHPRPETNRVLTPDEMYLIDSGGQYLDGTTDVTRTLHFGKPTDFQRDCFTRVLKGTIALVSAVFPNKIVGNKLDSFARKALWDVGLDYIHGTGHGIGHFLNVHEGPHGITYKDVPDDPGMQENMFVSNEPGYYQENEFGIRIENIIRVVQAKGLPNNFANRGYLTFADVTFVPIQQKLIKTELLTTAEINYINEYHNECRRKVGSYIEANGLDEDGFKWLLKETEPLRTVHVK